MCVAMTVLTYYQVESGALQNVMGLLRYEHRHFDPKEGSVLAMHCLPYIVTGGVHY